jgi:hypothetical protein
MLSLFSKIMEFLVSPLRRMALKKRIAQLRQCIENEVADDFIQILLAAMGLAFALDEKFRKNIEGFSARYVFRDTSGNVAASAIFSKGSMTMKCADVPGPTVTVVFDRGKSLCDLLLTADPNIFDFILDGRLWYYGNFNYLLKFAYMAKHLKLRFGL